MKRIPSEPPSLSASDVQRSGGGRPSLWRAPSEPRFQRLIPSERRDDVADVRDWRLLTLKKVLQKRGESAARGPLLMASQLRRASIVERAEPSINVAATKPFSTVEDALR